ncbi:MAG: 3'-5' exonuclease [Chitinophagaceae bacterium]|nr:3'-5' exonuclease [Chitinophagaceae bacterium]
MSPHPLHNILFLDIETVSQYRSFDDVPDEWKDLWRHKAESLLRDKQPATPEEIYGRSAIYAEFGKIICISCGIVSGMPADRKLSLKSFSGDDEKTLLTGFADLLRKWAPDHSKYLCAHNGKDFDFPYLCRRMIIHGVTIPAVLNISGKKPWEVQHIDTMDLWKFGEYKSFVSLNLLARTLGIPTPKDDIDGSKVGEVYWTEHDLPRIVTYCQKDVITVAQVYLRIHGESLIREENIELK